MEDDFFSDLVPVDSRPGKGIGYLEDAVLPAVPEPANGAVSGSDRLVAEDVPLPKPLGPPMGDSRGKKDLRDFEAATQVLFEATLKRFAGGLQRVLEDINRRMDSVENQVEQLGRSLADMRGVEGLREESLKERFFSMEKTLRDVSRGIQLIRDKQELAEAQAELTKLSTQASAPLEAVSPPAAAPKAPPAAAPAPAVVQAPPAAVAPPVAPPPVEPTPLPPPPAVATPAPQPVPQVVVPATGLAAAPLPVAPSAPSVEALPHAQVAAQAPVQTYSVPAPPPQVVHPGPPPPSLPVPGGPYAPPPGPPGPPAPYAPPMMAPPAPPAQPRLHLLPPLDLPRASGGSRALWGRALRSPSQRRSSDAPLRAPPASGTPGVHGGSAASALRQRSPPAVPDGSRGSPPGALRGPAATSTATWPASTVTRRCDGGPGVRACPTNPVPHAVAPAAPASPL
eukprot:jgi/Botrbrau1/22298/Bobra.0138s0050.1